MAEVWHPSEQKTNPTAGTVTCGPHANADTTFNSLSLIGMKGKNTNRAGAVSLTTASSSLSQLRLKTVYLRHCPDFLVQEGNSIVQTAGSEDQSNGTFLWIMSTVRDNTSETETTALGHQQWVTAAENNEDWKCYQPLVPVMVCFTNKSNKIIRKALFCSTSYFKLLKANFHHVRLWTNVSWSGTVYAVNMQ